MHRDLRGALADDEEAGTRRALARDRVAGRVVALLERVGDPLEVALLEAGEERNAGQHLGRGRATTRSTRLAGGRKRCSPGGALGELLDPSLGGFEPGEAEAEQLLAALPERNRLVELRLAALEPLDDLLELR